MNGVRAARRAARVAMLACTVTAVSACGGGGKDRSFELPAGGESDAVASGRVLVVTEADNECEPAVDCAAPATAACDVGNGNTRGLAVYRLGATGLLFDDPSRPGTPDGPEQTIATADNPRRLLVHPNDPTLVYVATRTRIQVFRLAASGGTRCIDQTLSDREIDPDAREDLDPVDLAIDPTIGNGVLYVAARGSNRVDAYTIAGDGTLPSTPTSCAVGAGSDEFSAVAPLTDDFVAVGGRSRINVYRRAGGQFVNPSPTPPATPTPAPSPAGAECVAARFLTEPTSSIGGAIVTDLVFEAGSGAPLGQLFVAEEVSRRIFTFPIDAEGVIDDDDTSSTHRAGLYERLLRHDVGGETILYASVFNEGRVDAFRLTGGLLPSGSFSRTAEDPDALPVGLALDPDTGVVLYVAQGGLGRVDGFRVALDGSLPDLPATSTPPVVSTTGADLETFPNDLAIIALP